MFTVTGHAIHICHSCLLTHFVMKRKEVAELCLVKVSDEFGLPVIVLKGKACSICDKIVFLIGSSQNCKLGNTLNVDSSGISSCCWQPALHVKYSLPCANSGNVCLHCSLSVSSAD